MAICGNGIHQIGGPQDRLPNGSCRECDRVRQRRYKAKHKKALNLMHEFEENGVTVNGRAFQEALQFILTVEPWRFDHVFQRDPDLLWRCVDKLKDLAGDMPVLAGKVAARL